MQIVMEDRYTLVCPGAVGVGPCWGHLLLCASGMGRPLTPCPLFQDGAEPAPDGREQCLWHGRVAPGK